MLDSVHWVRNDYSRVPFSLMHRQDTFDAEREKIFKGPTWLHLGLEAEIPRPGDFRATVAGDIPVIFNRGRDGAKQPIVGLCGKDGEDRMAGDMLR